MTIDRSYLERADSIARKAHETVSAYFFERKRHPKEPKESLVDFLYSTNPELALHVMYQTNVGMGDCVRSFQEPEGYLGEIDHVIHFVQVASTRIRMQRVQKRDIELAQERLRWLWRNYPYWWAKRYILEVLLRDPELSDQAFLKALHTEKHPWVSKRLPELEKKLRGHKETLPPRR